MSDFREILIHELFETQAEKTPDNIALVFNDQQLTYRELNFRANQLAGRLRKSGIKADTIVGIMIKRSFEMIIGILAVLKAGGAYLPIDPDYPEERVNYILEDSQAHILLTGAELAGKVQFAKEMIRIDDQALYQGDTSNVTRINTARDLAYLIYTSGSTGKPKGVMIEHSSVVNFIQGITEIIDFPVERSILALTTISFDIFVLETLLPLTKGLKVVIAGENQQKNPGLLSDLISHHQITMLQMTPSRMLLLLAHQQALVCLKTLETLMIGGEPFPVALLEKLKSLTNAKIYNMYGPTETTVWSTVRDLTGSKTVDIGRPILNTQIYIMNQNNQPQTNGSEGELWIGGAGLARGYFKQPELTAEKFIENPEAPEERIYKTGDLARWLPDGNIEHLGRIDFQVKIRGYRIELEEIEYHLAKYEAVKEAVVAAKQGKDGLYLCAYIVADGSPKAAEIRDYLAKILPEYMVPAHLIQLKTMPLTPNGKADRKRLPEPDGFTEAESSAPPDENEPEQGTLISKLLKILKENVALSCPVGQINPEERFVNLGMDSVSFIRFIVAIETEFNIEFDDDHLDPGELPNLSSIASYLEGRV